MKLSSSMRLKCVSAFFCLLLRRKVMISSLRPQKRSSALPLDSHLTSLCKSRSWCSADITDSSMRNKWCWRLDVERIKLIVAITLSIVVLNAPLSLRTTSPDAQCSVRRSTEVQQRTNVLPNHSLSLSWMEPHLSQACTHASYPDHCL